MKTINLFIITLLSMELAGQQTLIPFKEKDGSFSFARRYTKEKLTGRFNRINYFKEGIYQVWNGEKFGLYDTLGNELYPVLFDKCQNDICFQIDSIAGIIKGFSTRGKFLFRRKMDSLVWLYPYYKNDFIASLHGAIDSNGLITLPVYDLAWHVNNGLYEVGKRQKDGKFFYGVVDSTGKIVLPLKYELVTLFDDHIIAGDGLHVKEEAFDRSGKLLIKGFFKYLQVFMKADVYSCVKDDTEFTFALRDIRTNKEISDVYSDFRQLSDGSILVYEMIDYAANRYSIIGKGGKPIKQMGAYQHLFGLEHLPGNFSFEDTLGHKGVMGINKKLIFKIPDGFYVEDVFNKGFRIRNDKIYKEGFICFDGKLAIEPVYNSVRYIEDIDAWQVYTGYGEGEYFFVDEKGNRYFED